ncbi:DNA-directed RNA polymerase sigma-70 factor [Hallella multisaccharivorax DSM 17128]|uniref:RNA polymerase sigma factor n=1 Tax=Hallella multisaccharivorax DSM 17128 TaxID=688246 RepID=F8N9N0_9BACT|nr:RNA polymerase, sigma-24 subunit, ECF subfamily [Hallella multisaccharivorax DSM 17128]GJG30210.1 DNA-directed RNA polymerase sigma-70 factor [Hallella multisaccharivorax DSM 17128]
MGSAHVEKNEDKRLISLLSDPKMRERAFSSLVGGIVESLYWKIRHIVLSHEDADDILQETLVKAWTNLDKYEGKAKFSTWIYRIAVNQAIDFLRRSRSTDPLDSPQASHVAHQLMADEYFDGDEAQARLQEAIARLPEVQRAVFTMRYYDEMKYSEISKILGTSEGALKASYHLAMKKIRSMIEDS